jgi:hypothetical protein
MKTNTEAESYALQLCVNPVLLNEVNTIGETPDSSFPMRRIYAIWVLEAAYARSPDVLVGHIDRLESLLRNSYLVVDSFSDLFS